MIKCQECGEDKSVEECVIIQGNVMCVQCGIKYIQHRLEHVIKLLTELNNKMQFMQYSMMNIIMRLNDNDRQGEESKG
jgi:hypothetical protein